MTRKIVSLVMFLTFVGWGREVSLPTVESRTRVAVLDTGLYLTDEIKPFLCNDIHHDATNTGITDTQGHGTNIAHIIVRNLDPRKVCLTIIKITDVKSTFDVDTYLQGLRMAVQDNNVSYINISLGGSYKIQEEEALMRLALNQKKYIIVAAGNRGEQLGIKCNYYPACYKFLNSRFRVVANGKNEKHKTPYTNYGISVTDWMLGEDVCAGNLGGDTICLSGTSQSTALLTNWLIKREIK